MVKIKNTLLVVLHDPCIFIYLFICIHRVQTVLMEPSLYNGDQRMCFSTWFKNIALYLSALLCTRKSDPVEMGHWDTCVWKCVITKKRGLSFIHPTLDPSVSLQCTSAKWAVCKAPCHLYFLVTSSINMRLNLFSKGWLALFHKGQSQSDSEMMKTTKSVTLLFSLRPNWSCSHHQSLC